MGCQSCWDYYYRQQKEQYIAARVERGNEVRKKAIEPMICPCCNQPTNSKNESEEAFNAKNSI
jgi:hypothetical protein